LRGIKAILNGIISKEHITRFGSNTEYELSNGDFDSKPFGPTNSFDLKVRDLC
jgi:hypothetical protein